MTTRKRKQIEGWKYTREGRKAHYFTPDRDELERSLCGYLYYTGHLDSLSTVRSKCIRCERLLNEIAALPALLRTSDMSEDEIFCTHCNWSGHVTELHCRDEDENKSVYESRYDQCPGCAEVDCFENFEDDDDAE